MSLFRLIYASSAAPDLKLVDLEEILEASVRNNKPRDITGMLLYVGGGFLQALEGEETAVAAMYRKIESDPRHQGIVLIERSPIESRSFPTWSMGFKYLGVEDSSKREAVRNLFNYGFSSVTRDVKPGAALAMLREFST
jgi:hypothetical protein